MNTIQIIKSQLYHINNNPQDYGIIFTPYFLVTLLYNFSLGLPFWFIFILIVLAGIFLVVSTHRLVIINDRDYFNFNRNKISCYLKYIYTGFIFSIFIFIPLYCILIFDRIISNPYLSNGNVVIFYLLIFFVCGFLIFYNIGNFSLNLPKAAIGERVNFLKMRKESKGFRINIIFQYLLILGLYWILDILNLVVISNIFFQNFISALLATFSYGLTISCISKTFVIFSEKNKVANE